MLFYRSFFSANKNKANWTESWGLMGAPGPIHRRTGGRDLEVVSLNLRGEGGGE